MSQLGLLLFPIYGKIKNVPNHQPETFKIRDKLLLYHPCENWEILTENKKTHNVGKTIINHPFGNGILSHLQKC